MRTKKPNDCRLKYLTCVPSSVHRLLWVHEPRPTTNAPLISPTEVIKDIEDGQFDEANGDGAAGDGSGGAGEGVNEFDWVLPDGTLEKDNPEGGSGAAPDFGGEGAKGDGKGGAAAAGAGSAKSKAKTAEEKAAEAEAKKQAAAAAEKLKKEQEKAAAELARQMALKDMPVRFGAVSFPFSAPVSPRFCSCFCKLYSCGKMSRPKQTLSEQFRGRHSSFAREIPTVTSSTSVGFTLSSPPAAVRSAEPAPGRLAAAADRGGAGEARRRGG